MNNLKNKYGAIILMLTLAIGGQVEAKKKDAKSIEISSNSISVEEAYTMESWMFGELVPTEAVLSFEDWMFDELVRPEEVLSFEPWMFDNEYFSNN